jgi:hypothetical protein
MKQYIILNMSRKDVNYEEDENKVILNTSRKHVNMRKTKIKYP